jgi:putative SOS response-associated peptidase YedK
MCGRYALDVTGLELARSFDAMLGTGARFLPRFNLAPTMEVPVLRSAGEAAIRLDLLRWGLIPAWASDPAAGSRMINARSETVFEKPAFKTAVRERRCLVPATLFYEWKRDGRNRIPFGVRPTDGTCFGFAGIWERWDRGEELLETVAILTTSPNSAMSSIHDRMPVILDSDERARWLDHRSHDEGGPSEAELRSFLEPVADERLLVHRVSTRVNDVKHEGIDLMDPLDETPEDPEPPGLFG